LGEVGRGAMPYDQPYLIAKKKKMLKQVFVKARTGVLTITLTTPEELKEIVFPTFDAMIETMTLVKE
jgi:hypothetical protein